MLKNDNRDDELIRMYGEFIIRFESICSHLRFSILTSVFHTKYNEQRFRKMEILLEGITAENLRKKALALIIEDFKEDHQLLSLVNSIYKEFEKIIPVRNSLAHGTSLLNKFSLFKEFGDGLLTLRHPKLKSQGLDFNLITYDANTFNTLLVKIQHIGNAVELVYFAFKSAFDDAADKKEMFIKMALNSLDNIK